MGVFGASYNPDWRKVVGWTRNISLVSENVLDELHPPQGIFKFPDDLANRNLEYSGFYEDGWVGEDAFVRLAGNHETAQIIIKGQYPDGVPDAPSSSTIEVLADGVRIGEHKVTLGDFTIVSDLPATASNTVRIDIRSSASYHLPGADGRVASFRVLSIGWSPGRSATSSAPSPSAVPAALSRDPFQAKGIYPDGWVNGTASLRFQLGRRKRTKLTIAGLLPGRPPNGALSDVVHVFVDGTRVAEARVTAGNFRIAIPLPSPAEGDVELKLEGGVSHKLAPPDTRSASFRILNVEWAGEPDAKP